jgi:hypothetical protein
VSVLSPTRNYPEAKSGGTLLVIVAKEKEEGEASLDLRRAMDALQEALLRIQLSR